MTDSPVTSNKLPWKLMQARFDLLNRLDLFTYRNNGLVIDFKVNGTEYYFRYGWTPFGQQFYFYRLIPKQMPDSSEQQMELLYRLEDVLDQLSPGHQDFFIFNLDLFR